VGELAATRVVSGVSQRALARELGCSQSAISRLEALRRPEDIPLVRLAEIASLLGLELSAGLHPHGDALRDEGHLALIRRFRAQLSPTISISTEVPFPLPGDQRSWDLVLRIGGGQLVGVEGETRIRDLQSLVRRLHARQRDGGAHEIVLLLSDSRANSRLVGDLRLALGERYETPARLLLRCLRSGSPVPGSGVVLL
jgi:transcriptional regulator with XRE-family HTH domain